MTASATRPTRDGVTPQRDRIRLAAVKLFTRQGYEATTMKQLANELGMVPANVYNYYPNKEAILYEVLTHQLRSVLLRQAQLAAIHPDPVERLWVFAYDIVLNDLNDPVAAFVGHHGINGLAGAPRRRVSELMSRIRSDWIDTIREGAQQRRLVTSDPKLSALTALTLCSFVSSWFDPEGGAYTAGHVAAYTAGVVLRSVQCNELVGHYSPDGNRPAGRLSPPKRGTKR